MIPPRDHIPLGTSKPVAFPTVIDLAVPPLHTARHIPNSIATMR
jgi:hypothetical protein